MRTLFYRLNNRRLFEEKLAASEIRYRRLFESAKDGILILDFESGEIVDANPFIVKMIDYPLAEILGKKLWEIGLFSNKEDSEQAVIELKTNGYIRFEDMPIQRPSGKITEVEFISNVYLVNNTKVIQCNIRDITARKHAEFALKQSEINLQKQNAEYLALNKEYLALNEELKESITRIQNINIDLNVAKERAEGADKLKSAFLANMSHEIRTPMNAIIGFSDFVLQPGLSKEKLEEFVRIISASSQRLLSVISDIIDISKIESDQIKIHSEMVDINGLMNDLFCTYKKLIGSKNIALNYVCDKPEDHIWINTDGFRVKQILYNLLNNAVKFTSEGKVEYGYTVGENTLSFYVKDTGIGIAAENQSHIFEHFRKVDSLDKVIYEGNGLGLSISKALAEKLGGYVAVESTLGEGSTFSLTIPYIREIPYTGAPSLVSKTNGIGNWEGKHILIVEDDKISHAYIQELLEGTNAKILHAWNGLEAVEFVKSHTDISLVLMDMKMPIMDGYEATKLIKQIRPNLPVVAQTAFALSDDKQKALAAGCDNYIPKPINRSFFMEVVNSYLPVV